MTTEILERGKEIKGRIGEINSRLQELKALRNKLSGTTYKCYLTDQNNYVRLPEKSYNTVFAVAEAHYNQELNKAENEFANL